MNGRPLASRSRDAAPRSTVSAGPPRVGRSVAGPRRGRPGDARVGGRDLRRRRVVRVRLPDHPGRPARQLTDAERHRVHPRRGPRTRTCSASRRDRWWRPSSRCRPSARRTSTSACRRPSRSPSTSACRCWSGRSATGATWPTPTARSSRSMSGHAAGRRRRPAGRSTIAGPRSTSLDVGVELDAVDLDAATRLASLVPARRRQRGGLAGGQRHRRERVRARDRGRTAGRRSSASTPRACARPT